LVPRFSAVWIRSSRSLAEAIIAFFFKYHLILFVKYFLFAYANGNYLACISSTPILVRIRVPKSTKRLADEGWASLISSTGASHVQTR
jgi:hypothetical protein